MISCIAKKRLIHRTTGSLAGRAFELGPENITAATLHHPSASNTHATETVYSGTRDHSQPSQFHPQGVYELRVEDIIAIMAENHFEKGSLRLTHPWFLNPTPFVTFSIPRPIASGLAAKRSLLLLESTLPLNSTI